MATLAENERLAVLESQYKRIETDISEIKTDVKAIIATQIALAQAAAVKIAAERQEMTGRQATGVWVRSMLPWFVSGIALALSIFNRLQLT